MPNTTLTPRDLKKINKEISLDQQVLQQLTPELLDTILKNQKQKTRKASKQPRNTKDPKIIDLMEQITTTLPNTTLPRKDLEKIMEKVFGDENILEQLVPDILRAILRNQRQEMYEESKQTTNTNVQKIIDLVEQITTPSVALCNNELKYFTPDELKNAIYRYKKNVTRISDLRKITQNRDVLDQLTDIALLNYLSESD